MGAIQLIANVAQFMESLLSMHKALSSVLCSPTPTPKSQEDEFTDHRCFTSLVRAGLRPCLKQNEVL